MSEYQMVQFRAVDGPLTDEQLEYMDRQSSRAVFSKWEYKVEYYYSSFRGDVNGMLRNGYDVFLTYSNYDANEVRLRLPDGLPFGKSVWSKYIGVEGLEWIADPHGKAGILVVSPLIEEADEQSGDFDDYLDAAAQLREMLIAGDLRALYVLWLCCATNAYEDEGNLKEPPVPHGLPNLSSTVKNLLLFFMLDPLLVDAAAIDISDADVPADAAEAAKCWIGTLSPGRRAELIERLIVENPIALQRELLTEIRDQQPTGQWPTTTSDRTVSQLLEACERLRKLANEKTQRQAAVKEKRDAEKAEKLRQTRMVEIKKDPNTWLKKASQLVECRGTDNYREAASILADLREAIGGTEGEKIARKHATQLARKYPTLAHLKCALRQQRLWG
jgi:hypothetical protein